MATSYEAQQKLNDVVLASTKPQTAPSLDSLASLKSLAFFEDRIAGKKDSALSLVELTAKAELENIRRGMFLLQSNPVLKQRLGEGLSSSIVASKLASQYIAQETFQGVMRSTFNAKANENDLKALGMDIGMNVKRIGGSDAFIQGLS